MPLVLPHPWRITLAAALACLCAAVLLLGPGLAPAPSPITAASSTAPLANLPLAARGPISAALGRAEPAYRIENLKAANPAQGFKVAFSARGAGIADGAAHLGLSLTALGRPGELTAIGPAAPRAAANHVSYAHRGVLEWYANGPIGLEQGFVVAARPAGTGGPLTLGLRLSGNVQARAGRGGVLLATAHRRLRYTGLVATDARGRRLPAHLALRGKRLLIEVTDAGAPYPIRIDPYVEVASINAPSLGFGPGGVSFGYAVASSQSGATIVIGAPDVVGYPVESDAFVFQRGANATGWQEVAGLGASGGFSGDDFGASVGISEDGHTIVVGAPAQGASSATGSAYVFVEPPSGWTNATQTATLAGSTVANGDEFGQAVSISGDTVVVGAPDHTISTRTNEGLAYVFLKPAGGWGSGAQPQTQSARLEASDGVASEQVGCSAAISGATIVLGGPGDKWCNFASSASFTGAGAAYVFAEPGGGWSGLTNESAELSPSDGGAGDAFGSSVALAGDTIAVGAARRSGQQGAVYAFQRSAAAWASGHQTAELTAPALPGGAELGSAVAVSANASAILAGAEGTGETPGAAYVYDRGAGGWASGGPSSTLVPANPQTEEDFGLGAAWAGDAALVGAPYADFIYGAVYVDVPKPAITISSPSNGATYSLGQAVKASYACTAPAGITIISCAGSVANGAALNTATLGTHSFTVSAADSDGARGAQTVSYNVVLPPPPKITKAKLTHSKFAISSKPTATSARHPSHKPPKGTTIEFTLSEAASVTLTISGTGAGKHSGGTLKRRSEKAGADKVAFSGRIGHHALPPGRYSVTVGASNSTGGVAKTVTLRFTVERP